MNFDYLKNVSQKARKTLTLPKTEDKIICFIPSWERYVLSSLSNDTSDNNEDFIVNENKTFNNIRTRYLDKGFLRYTAIQKFNDDYIDDDKLKKIIKENSSIKKEEKMMKNWKDNFFKNQKKRELFDLNSELDFLVERDIEVYPNNDTYKKIINKDKLANLNMINILCIDYKYFPYSLVKQYIKHYEILTRRTPNNIKDNLKPLFKLFSSSSADINLEIYPKIAKIIHKVYSNQFTTKDQDELEFLSNNHLQNIQPPPFWNELEKNGLGYLCPYNADGLKTKEVTDKNDIRFFYSFQSLLFFELKQMLTKVKRCQNCNLPIQNGSYCQEKDKNYKKCLSERNRKRQRKHYEKLKT